jgi:hypothetical protein
MVVISSSRMSGLLLSSVTRSFTMVWLSRIGRPVVSNVRGP